MSRAAPRSSASRCASARLPTTTTSPSEIPLGLPTSIDCTHTRCSSSVSSPVSNSPSSTSTMALTRVGASFRLDVSRVSRTNRRASVRSVTTPASAPSPSTIGVSSSSARVIANPAARIGSSSWAIGTSVRMTSRARSRTWGSSRGSVAPLRSNSQRVCGLHSPSRTGTYSCRGSSRDLSSAYPSADAIESVSGLR